MGAEAAHDDRDDLPELEESPFKHILVDLFCGGHVSATAVQRLSHAAVLSGLLQPDVARLAALGAVGEQPGNISRDLLRSLSSGNKLPAPFPVRVPCIDPATQEYCVEVAYVMLPHQLWAMLPEYENSDHALRTDGAHAFWEKAAANNDPRLDAHPMKNTGAGWKSTYVPGYLHGDGVEFINGDSLMTYHWGTLLNTADSLSSCFLLAAWPKSATTKTGPGEPGTWDVLLEVLCWSLRCCFEGSHPTTGPFGQELSTEMQALAGLPLRPGVNLRLCIWQILGDHEFFPMN